MTLNHKQIVCSIICLGFVAILALGSSCKPKDYKDCNVPKADGSYETTRCNDLEELCKDYIFFRKEILKANQEGDNQKVIEYRADFEKVNIWLKAYKESDVEATFSRLED